MAVDFHEHRIPLRDGEAVSIGWTPATGGRPAGVTWHWTAIPDLQATRALIGPEGARRGEASCHLCVGRDRAEGVDRYVDLAHRSWHAGKGQTLDWRGRPSTEATKGARTTIGIETCHVGYAREGVPAGPDWIRAAAPDGRPLVVAPWPAAQVDLMVEVGRYIVQRCPWIRPDDHHGHADLCPRHKADVTGFPFAEVLRRIYDDPFLPDVWTPFLTVDDRRRALRGLGHRLPDAQGWTEADDRALREVQRGLGLVVDGCWTVFVSRAVAARVPARA